MFTSVERTLEMFGLSLEDQEYIKFNPELAQGIAAYVKEYLQAHPEVMSDASQSLKDKELRGYYDAGPLDHQFDGQERQPWIQVLNYDVDTLFDDDGISEREAQTIARTLRRNGVSTIRDLLLLRQSLLQDFQRLGDIRIKTIVDQLARHGVRLTDERDLKEVHWIDAFAIVQSKWAANRKANQEISPTSLPYESFRNLPAALFLPGIHPSAGRAGLRVGDVVKFQPSKTVELSLYSGESRKYVGEPWQLQKGFEAAGFRVVVK